MIELWEQHILLVGPNKIVCCGNKVSFLWVQNNKLWEQDIILREENILFLVWPVSATVLLFSD
jgi:hypothetical protein